MFNIFLDPLPTKLIHDNKIIPFKTDFRTWINIINVLNEGDKIQIYKNLKNLFFQDIELNDNIIQKLLNFLACEKNINIIKTAEEGEKKASPQLYDLIQDGDAVFISFFSFYKIDLEKIDYLHWYKFKLLLSGLDNSTALGKRIELRSIDVSSIKDSKTRSKIIKAKREIALNKPKKHKTAEERQRDFNNSFSKMFL